ncbi:MAG: hypothetical protein ACT4OT_17245 [Acidobacteriota bacterium]
MPLSRTSPMLAGSFRIDRISCQVSLWLPPLEMNKAPNGGVDAAARFHSTIAAPIILRNTLPPLASNDLLGVAIGSKQPEASH